MTVPPATSQISLGMVSAQADLSHHAQADVNLCWVHVILLVLSCAGLKS